jgi:hypothetical protein
MTFNEKYKKEELERLIFIENLPYKEIGRIYGVSDTYIKKVANKFGILLKKRKNHPVGFVPHNKGTAKKITCKHCGGTCIQSHKKQIFCSHNCSTEYKKIEKYNHYIDNQEDYCKVTSGINWLKKYILDDQGNKCAICGIGNIWNGKPLVFVLDHIDGNASNNIRTNLRLVCNNCDSQLDTYKSKNKNSARKERYLLRYKNI